MDPRRLDTGEVLEAGILGLPTPKTDTPKDREEANFDYNVSTAKVIEALEAGKVANCSEYYGIPQAWKEGEEYRGILLQYRSVTANETFGSAAECAEWFTETARAVMG